MTPNFRVHFVPKVCSKRMLHVQPVKMHHGASRAIGLVALVVAAEDCFFFFFGGGGGFGA